MVMLLWMQAGFAMVLLSAAIKGVPTETLEAARLDGAGEGAIFFRIVVPQIRTTLITVFITVLIGVLKTFDIVYVMTNGNFNTNVIAVDFFNQLFTNRNAGYAAAIVVILLVIMIPSWCSRSVSSVPRRPPDERNTGGHAHPGPAPQGDAVRRQARAPWASEVNKSPIWVRVVLALICLPGSSRRWVSPSRRSGARTTPPRRGGGRLHDPGELHPADPRELQRGLQRGNMGEAFANSLAITIPATIIPILIAAFAAYAFTFMQFPGRDFLLIVIVGPARGAVPGGARPAAEDLRHPGDQRHVPGDLAGAHRLRHAAGRLHHPQLHGDAAGKSSSRPRSTGPATSRPSGG